MGIDDGSYFFLRVMLASRYRWPVIVILSRVLTPPTGMNSGSNSFSQGLSGQPDSEHAVNPGGSDQGVSWCCPNWSGQLRRPSGTGVVILADLDKSRM